VSLFTHVKSRFVVRALSTVLSTALTLALLLFLGARFAWNENVVGKRGTDTLARVVIDVADFTYLRVWTTLTNIVLSYKSDSVILALN
jgi:hypothetical protein